MILEDYCSFETAKLFKEKGFDERTLSYYEDNVLCRGDWFEWNRSPLGHIAAPTHQMAMKWLREKHKIMITIIPQEINVGVDRMCYAIYRITEDLYQPLCNGKVDNLVDSYEETVEAAIKYCLENLV